MSVFPPLRIVVPAKILICLKMWLKTGAHQVLLWSHHHHVVLWAKSGRRVLEHHRILEEGGGLRRNCSQSCETFIFMLFGIEEQYGSRKENLQIRANLALFHLLCKKFIYYLHGCKPGTLCVLSMDPGRKSFKY